MENIKYIILGIFQGITEPIPVSSSGHLVILRRLISAEFFYNLNFEIIVNFGSLIAVIYFFRNDLKTILNDFFSYLKTKEKKAKSNYNYTWLIIIGTIPAAIIGLIAKDLIEANLSNIKIIGFALLLTASFLFIIKDMKGTKEDHKITIKDALVIGLFQAVALIPGISRSGATIVGSMFRNLKRETAFKYSFLLFIPVSVASMVLGLKDILQDESIVNLLVPYFLGLVGSTIFTYYALGWFNNIIKKGKLIYFVYYCLIVGVLVILFL